MKKEQKTTYLVLKDDEGIFRPMAFIVTKNPMGEDSVKEYTKKLNEGESIVEVEFVEVSE